MAPFERHIFICCNQREPGHPRGCCDPDADDGLQKAFKKALAERGLNRRIRANKSGCLDQCEHGPTVVVYPDTVWYGGVREEDIAEIIESHLVGGRPVERLRLPDECVNTASCQHKPRAQAPGSRAPGSRAQASGSSAQAPGSSAQAPGSSAQASGSSAQAPGSRPDSP